MAFPAFFIINILLAVFWIFFRKWYFIISLVCVIIGWGSFRKYSQIRPGKIIENIPEESFKLLTYNVRLFNYYQWNEDTETRQKIIDYILAEKPDIICFQEFIDLPGTQADIDNLRKTLSSLSYTHIHYTNTIPGKLNFGMATFSRYPIYNKGAVSFKGTLNGSIYSDIIYDKDTIRIYNCHLQSVQLKKDYSNLLDSLLFNYTNQQLADLKDISTQMRNAFILRAEQVDILAAHISNSPYPVILCGDFNDTPVSYSYNKLSKGMQDSFVESGSGAGQTYRGFFPYMRIDYILYNKAFKSYNYKINKVDWSDHFPVSSEFTVQ